MSSAQDPTGGGPMGSGSVSGGSSNAGTGTETVPPDAAEPANAAQEAGGEAEPESSLDAESVVATTASEQSEPRPTCRACGAEVMPEDGYCENCGADLMVRRAEPPDPALPPCAGCGGTGYSDGYCDNCGKRAPSNRDRIERDLGRVAGVTDRGLRHPRNEDAMAFAVLDQQSGRPATVVVVCDGVSTSTDPHLASQAGADTALEHLVAALRRGEKAAAAASGAIEAAQRAVVELAAAYTDSETAPSTTMALAVVEPGRVTAGWVGDSRVYWLAEDPAGSLRLTEDDTWAGLLIAQNAVAEAEAYKAPNAHAIMRWLGPDAPTDPPHVREYEPTGPGLVLVCSDGLWNYHWDAQELGAATAGGWGGLAAAAASLVASALEAGGHDNITAVLAGYPPRDPEADPGATTAAAATPAAAGAGESGS